MRMHSAVTPAMSHPLSDSYHGHTPFFVCRVFTSLNDISDMGLLN